MQYVVLQVEFMADILCGIDGRQYPLRRISSYASPQQSLPEQNWQASSIPPDLHDRMGNYIWCHSWLHVIRRAHCMPIHAWLCRGSVFRKHSTLPVTTPTLMHRY
jgi:hypothetical protein